MTEQSRPTPVSGMPAAVAATSAAKPSADEISAPKSDATVVILAALDALRVEMRERFEAVEKTTGAHSKTLEHLSDQVAKNTADIAKQADTLASVARASAIAAELSAQAMAKVSTAEDDAKKMVESAMTIQKGAIEAAVRIAVKPISDDVEKQEQRLDALASEVSLMKATQDRVANELGLAPVTEGSQIVPADKERPGRVRTLTRQQKVAAVLIIISNLSTLVAHLLNR